MAKFDSSLIKFNTPFRMTIGGPSGTGKTSIIFDFLENIEKIIENFDIDYPVSKLFKVKWCYGAWQKIYEHPIENKRVIINYEEGFPTNFENSDLIVFDDLMNELSGNKQLSNIFTKYSHHKSISVIFITQNIFHHGKEMRNISLNSQYIILTKNKRDPSQIMSLARQIYPSNPKILFDAYKLATNLSDFGYLLIDLTPKVPNELQLRTNITSENPIVFVSNVGNY
jgi:hypothetical protein